MTGKRFTDAEIEEVRRRTRLVELVGRDVSLKARGGVHWACCPFHAERTASFKVDEGRGFYHCFGCGAHGGAIDWLMERHGLSFTEAVEDLAVRAGLMPDREGRAVPKAKPVARPDDAAQAREQEEKIGWALSVWARSGPAAGTPVEAYLRSRGITLLPPPTLRFHGGLRHTDTGLHLPAMVAAVQAADRRIVGIHRTYLKTDGSGKAPVALPKKMGGVCWRGAVRFAPPAERLALAEGIETALSVMQATRMPVWAALSLGNMGAIVLPDAVRAVVLCADADAKDSESAEQALRRAAEAHARAGRKVEIARPPEGMDFNDVLRGGGRRDSDVRSQVSGIRCQCLYGRDLLSRALQDCRQDRRGCCTSTAVFQMDLPFLFEHLVHLCQKG